MLSKKKIFTINIKKKCILLLIFFPLIFIGCKNNNEKIIRASKVPTLEILYNSAYQEFEFGDWAESVKLFQKVETNYSFTEWASKATMMIIFIYYESSDNIKCLEYISKFEKLYPKHKNLDYVEYIRALVFYERTNIVSKDQSYTEAALKEFNKIIKKYPNSIYAADLILKKDLINDQLAGKEMFIARYYMKKSKWIAAIKRLKIVIEEYPNTIFVKEALHRLVEIYYHLGNIKESKKYAAILGYNFNDSDWYKKTYKIIVDKNYSEEREKDKKKLRDKIKKIFKFSKW